MRFLGSHKNTALNGPEEMKLIKMTWRQGMFLDGEVMERQDMSSSGTGTNT